MLFDELDFTTLPFVVMRPSFRGAPLSISILEWFGVISREKGAGSVSLTFGDWSLRLNDHPIGYLPAFGMLSAATSKPDQ